MITCERYHDISCGHRVVGHEGKCRHLHGHNYRVHFTCMAEPSSTPLDAVGRVIDFSAIKSKLCEWLEDKWDHRMLLYADDPALEPLRGLPRANQDVADALDGIVVVPFNPTAEQMADYLLRVVAPVQLDGTGVQLIACRVEETRKCSATATLSSDN